MGEYIELINKLRQEAEWEAYLQPNSANETPKLLSEAADVIEKLSKERKKGKWIDLNTSTTMYMPRYKCSICDGWANKSNFCPNCGADMRGEEDGNI